MITNLWRSLTSVQIVGPDDTEEEIGRWQTALDNCHTEILRLTLENNRLRELNRELRNALNLRDDSVTRRAIRRD